MSLGWTNTWKVHWSNQASSQKPNRNGFVCLHSPPPFFPHRYGNLHTFPSPMAYPTQDSRKSNFPFQDPLSGTVFSFSSSTGTLLWSRSSNGTACFTSEGELRSTVLWPVFPITGTTVTPQSDNNPPQSSTVLSSCRVQGYWLECFWVNTILQMGFKKYKENDLKDLTVINTAFRILLWNQSRQNIIFLQKHNWSELCSNILVFYVIVQK